MASAGGGRPVRVLEAFGLAPLEDWPRGVYAAAPGLALRIIVVSELPDERDTLLVRLMGAGATLARAVREARSLPSAGWEREAAHAAVVMLRSRVSGPGEEEVAMQVEETYAEWYQRVRAEGRVAGEARGAEALADAVLKVLASRFGALPEDVATRVRGSDLRQLERLMDRALSAATVADALSD
jgi:hypothetical protein